MPLRDAPTPRMAGHLPFMRSPTIGLADLLPGQVAVFGATLAGGAGGSPYAPRALRETSVYFGSHFSSNMKAAMDIDRRAVLSGSGIAGRLVELGDIDLDRNVSDPSSCVAALAEAVCRQGAIPLMLGGAGDLMGPFLEGVGRGLGQRVASIRVASDHPPPAHAPFAVQLDVGDFASIWHGGATRPSLGGLSLTACRARMAELGVSNLAGMAITGLDPMRQGLSLVKTGQRLLVTAILDLIYARLGALRTLE
jgi:agmatinase